MCDGGELGFTTNDEELASRFLQWANDKSMGDVLGFDFAEWMWFTSEELAMNDMMTILLFLQQLSRKKRRSTYL